MALVVKKPTAYAGDVRDADSVLVLGRSPGGGRGKPLQYSCLENPMDRGAAVLQSGLQKSWTRLMQLSKSSVAQELIYS